MTPLIITIALLAIAAVGVWGWIRNNRAHKLGKKRAGEESERLAAERKRADEKAAAEAKAREDARSQAEAKEQSRKEAEARENARLAEKQRVAAEELAAEAEAKRRAEETALADTQAREAARLKEEAEAKQRAEDEAREMARLAGEAEQQAQERARADACETAQVFAEESRRHAEQKVEEDGDGEVTRAEEVEPCRERAPVSPEDRGGRSRATVPEKEGGSEKKRRPRAAKPEIVCLKRQREWILAVELPDDFRQGQSVTVTQDGNPLEKDETEIACWRLAHLHGEVIVRVLDDGGERLFKLLLGDEGCLIFKLCGDDRNRGRHVKSPSSGSCLAVVPEEWKRDEELAGAPPYEPEDVHLPGHRAHFFEL